MENLNLVDIKKYEIATPEDLEVGFNTIKLLENNISELKDKIKVMKDIQSKLEERIIQYHEENNSGTYKSENGKINETNSDSWKYEDEKSIVNQLKSVAPQFVRVKEEIDKTPFKKACTVNEFGEVYLEVDGQFVLIDNVSVTKERKLSVKV